jgi:hypothetical protein
VTLESIWSGNPHPKLRTELPSLVVCRLSSDHLSESFPVSSIGERKVT